MKILKNITFLFFITVLSYIQAQNESDTIKVVTLEDFQIATVFHYVTKVKSLDINIRKKTSEGFIDIPNNNFIKEQFPENRELETIINQSKNRGLGPSVQFKIDGYLVDVGDYVINLTLKYVGNFRRPKPEKIKTFFVKVGYPKLITIGTLRTTYFWGDSAEFSLAFTGLNNKDDFNYFIVNKVTNDTLKKELMTQIIKIDSSITNSPDLIRSKKVLNLKIILTYKGDLFEFFYDGNLLRSDNFIKELSVRPPRIEVQSLWSNNETDYTPITLDNPRSLEFDFYYYGGHSRKTGYYKYIDLKILDTPTIELLDGEDLVEFASPTPTPTPTGRFGGTRVKLKVKKPNYDSLEPFNVYKTKIAIKFKTQFGEQVKKIFTAKIYN